MDANTDTKTLTINIKDFVSTERKLDLIGVTVQEASAEGFVNPVLLRILFEVNTLFVYTDVEVLDRNDKLEAYDEFRKANLWGKFYEAANVDAEIDTLWTDTMNFANAFTQYNTSISGILDSLKLFVGDIVDKTTENLAKLENVDLDKLSQVLPIAQALGVNFGKGTATGEKTVEG